MKRSLLILSFATLTFAQTSDSRKLLELSGGIFALEQIFNPATMESQLRSTLNPNAVADPTSRAKMERFITEFAKEFSAEAKVRREELIKMAEQSQERYYTPAEIKQLIAFYESPLGRKLSVNGPKAMLELSEMGRKWGENLGREIGQRVSARIDADDAAKKK